MTRRFALALTLALAVLAVAAAPVVGVDVLATAAAEAYYFEVEGQPGRSPALRLEPGEEVTVSFLNGGRQYHNLRFGPPIDAATPLLAPGEQHTLRFTVPSDDELVSQYWCQPHKSVGMFGFLLLGNVSAPEEETPVVAPLVVALALLALAVARRRAGAG